MGTRVNGVSLDGGTSVALSDATPAALGTASPGVSTEASRADHVHEAPAGGGVDTGAPGAVSLAGAAVDYSTSPAGVSLERGDTSVASRNGLRFWGRGVAVGTIAGTAPGLRITATVVTGAQALPFADGGTSIFVALPATNEIEVDLHLTLDLPALATGGNSVNVRAGLLAGVTGRANYALFSYGGVNGGNPTEEWSGYGSAQASTSEPTSRVVRLRRRGAITEVWTGATADALTRRFAATTLAIAMERLSVTVGINSSYTGGLGSYVELATVAIRDRWTP